MISALALLGSYPALATPDFYGVQMKNEGFARDVTVRENLTMPDFTNDRPGTDKRIYAQAYTSSTIGAGRGVSIHVFNHSDKPLETERLYRELIIVTYNGDRYDRSEAEMMLTRDLIEPGKDATFNYTFPGVKIPKDEIEMIICSFGLGETKIFLFPMPPTEEPVPVKKEVRPYLGDLLKDWNFLKNRSKSSDSKNSQLQTQDPSGEDKPKFKTEKRTIKKKIKKKIRKPIYEDTSKVSADAKPHDANHPITQACQTPIKIVQSFFKNMGKNASGADRKIVRYEDVEIEEEVDEVVYDKVLIQQQKKKDAVSGDATRFSVTKEQMDKELPKVYPLVKSEQVIEGIKYNFSPESGRIIHEGEVETKRIVEQERPWTLEAPPAKWERHQRIDLRKDFQPRSRAEVVVYDQEHNFIVFNAGLEDGFGKDMLVDIMQDGKRIAKAMVIKPRDHICGALLLPEWQTAKTVKLGDIVGIN